MSTVQTGAISEYVLGPILALPQRANFGPHLPLDRLHQEDFGATLFLSILVITSGDDALISALIRWFRREKPEPDQASEIARVLFDECVVLDRVSNDVDWGVPRELMSAFTRRARLYREAAGLMVLIRLAKEQEHFEPVLQAYERVIFGNEPTPEGKNHLREVKAAMADLSDLIAPNIGELSWSRRWFDKIEFTTVNPADAALFATTWPSLLMVMYRATEPWHPTQKARGRSEIAAD